MHIQYRKYSYLLGVCLALIMVLGQAQAQTLAEQKVKNEIQKQLGDRAKVTGVKTTPIKDLYEIAIGNDIVYADASGRYLIQGELIDLKSGTNLTEQRSNEINRIKWSDLPLNDAIKIVRGNGARQIAVFADPNCGFCKRLEKSFQDLNNVTIYNFLVPMLSADSLTKSQQIWCASDRAKVWSDWMVGGVAPSGKTDCAHPLDRNTALAKKLGVTGTPAMFFVDGSRIAGAVPLAQIEKKLK